MGVYMRDYTAARTVFGILEFVAWVAVIGGLIVAVVGATAATGFSGRAAGLMGAIPGLAMSFLGIIAAATVQFYRAGVDSAENSGQMLEIAKEQLQMARKAHGATPLPTAKSSADPVRTDTKPPVDVAEFDPLTFGGSTRPVAFGTTPGSETVGYNGEEIAVIDGKYHWGEQSFQTIEAAKAAIHLQSNRSQLASPEKSALSRQS